MGSYLLPSVLDFNVEGGPHFTTRWEGDTLVFYPQGWWVASKPPVRSQPPEDRWRSFETLLDDLGAWGWQGDFSAGVMCGTPWKLRIEWGDRSVHCSGNSWLVNAAPEGFRQFVVGLAALVGLSDTQLAGWAADQ